MNATEVLDRLSALGVTARASGEKLLLEPGSKVPPELLAEVRQHKGAILDLLDDPLGDGQPPPLDRPPQTEQELRRLYESWEEDPEAFTRWLESLMAREE